MANFIHEKISDCVEQGQFAFTIPGKSGKQAGPIQYNRNPITAITAIQAGQPIERDRMLFWACTYFGIFQKTRQNLLGRISSANSYFPETELFCILQFFIL